VSTNTKTSASPTSRSRSCSWNLCKEKKDTLSADPATRPTNGPA
jgi:hypothetical protein